MAPYARLEVILIALVGGAITAVLAHVAPLWAILPAVLTLALLGFYRDPARRAPGGNDLILAPADGQVVEISPDATGADGSRVLRIMIFLRVYDVHLNRSPCAGRVTDVQYRRGAFVNALNSAADARNECNTVTLDPQAPLPGPVRVRQIAGVLARRIVCAVKSGDYLTAGDRFGMIKLGSRTEVCVPADPRWEVLVRPGQKVRAGVTVLVRLRPAGAT